LGLLAAGMGANTVTAPDNSPQALLGYAQTLITGEELMFIMDVPAVPPQQTPIVLAHADAPSAPPLPTLF